MNPVLKRIITALSTAALVVLAIIYAPPRWIVPAFAVLMAFAFLEFVLLLRKKSDASLTARAAVFLAGCASLCGLAALPAIAAMKGDGVWMLYVIAIVKFSDMGGFAFGMSSAKLMKGGNHKLCPTISPNKSWEGLFGSVLASVLMSLAFVPFTHFAWPKAVAFGVVAALVGTFGDLVESKFKRWVGVKDSATFMPAGLGGFLDMFDSLLFAPVVLLPFI